MFASITKFIVQSGSGQQSPNLSINELKIVVCLKCLLQRDNYLKIRTIEANNEAIIRDIAFAIHLPFFAGKSALSCD